jgi:ribonucleotide monophosphatase NagD (HAD superfamily)
LYLMDQLGVAIMGWTPVEEADTFMKNKEMKYLILNDSARFNKFYPNKLEDQIIMYHRGLIIYKLR